MDDISEVVGVSKATFYSVFKSREEILDSIIVTNLKNFSDANEILNDESVPYVDRYIQSSNNLIEKMKEINPIYLEDLNRLYPNLMMKIHNHQLESLMKLNEYYIKGVELGYYRSDIHTSIMTLSDKLFFHALINPEFLEQNNITPARAFADYFNMKLNGILKKG
jgi:AcrR family transcriptional regulator